VTVDAVFQLLKADILLLVFFDGLIRLVLVATVTCEFGIAARVADLASHFTFLAMIQREAVDVEQSRCPGLGRVA
jgi:hypothetical protein